MFKLKKKNCSCKSEVWSSGKFISRGNHFAKDDKTRPTILGIVGPLEKLLRVF